MDIRHLLDKFEPKKIAQTFVKSQTQGDILAPFSIEE